MQNSDFPTSTPPKTHFKTKKNNFILYKNKGYLNTSWIFNLDFLFIIKQTCINGRRIGQAACYSANARRAYAFGARARILDAPIIAGNGARTTQLALIVRIHHFHIVVAEVQPLAHCALPWDTKTGNQHGLIIAGEVGWKKYLFHIFLILISNFL